MRTRRVIAAGILAGIALRAEDFKVMVPGAGPVNLHTQLTYEGKGERLVASATNDSGAPIPYVKLCIAVSTNDCLFALWNNVPWQPGAKLEWNLTSGLRMPDLSEFVTVADSRLSTLTAPAPVPAASPGITAAKPAGTATPSAGALGNESIIKLVRAGLGEDVITVMIATQPGNYSVDPESIIALKQAGASDKVISAILSNSGHGGPASAPLAARTYSVPGIRSDPNAVLHDGTPVRLRLRRNLSSASAKTGDTVDFEVLDDVLVGDMIVIARGTTALGTVTDAEAKKRMARGGKLDVTIDSVRLTNGNKVALRGTRETSGGGHTGAMTAGIVATALVVWPAAPFFLFMHGKDTVIPEGTEITAYVNAEIPIRGCSQDAQNCRN